jgi:uncharacterized coiled-coil DUF342 family protein
VDYTRQPNLMVILAAMVWMAMMASWPADAASPWDTMPALDTVRSRLNLTPEQESKIVPLFERRLSELQQTRVKLEQAPSRQEKRSVLRDAKRQGDTFNTNVESLLNTQQKSEWREIRKETREKLRERAEEKHESG